jgi:hypothetical protein
VRAAATWAAARALAGASAAAKQGVAALKNGDGVGYLRITNPVPV